MADQPKEHYASKSTPCVSVMFFRLRNRNVFLNYKKLHEKEIKYYHIQPTKRKGRDRPVHFPPKSVQLPAETRAKVKEKKNSGYSFVWPMGF